MLGPELGYLDVYKRQKILRAYNGLTAKEIIAEERPELILCDIGMPQCNGIEVLKLSLIHI